jgi:hypothetical protein
MLFTRERSRRRLPWFTLAWVGLGLAAAGCAHDGAPQGPAGDEDPAETDAAPVAPGVNSGFSVSASASGSF